MTARREQILVHSYIQIHAQFFVQILVVKLIAQILCTFFSAYAPAALIRHVRETRRCTQQRTKSALAEEANL